MRVYSSGTMAHVRTNVVLDDDLIKRVMERYGLSTRRETIDFALRRLDPTDDPWAAMLALEGTGWDGDLAEMRRTRFPDF
jgi:Arc/MetJ family transcription regulator